MCTHVIIFIIIYRSTYFIFIFIFFFIAAATSGTSTSVETSEKEREKEKEQKKIEQWFDWNAVKYSAFSMQLSRYLDTSGNDDVWYIQKPLFTVEGAPEAE